MIQRNLGALPLCLLLIAAPLMAQAAPKKAEVFREGDWTGHLVYEETPSEPTRCTVTKTSKGVTLTFIRNIDDNAALRIDFDPQRAKNLGNFAIFVDGDFIRGPASYSEEEGVVEKQFLEYENEITQSILDLFRSGQEVTFEKAAVDLPAISLQGAGKALKRLDSCRSWSP